MQYTKKLKTLTIHMDGNDDPIVIEDTALNNKATRALAEFDAYDTMHDNINGAIAGIPFHAVKYIVITETNATITKPDAYGCE